MEQEKDTQPQLEKQPLIKPALSIMGAHFGGIIIALVLCFTLAYLMTGGWLILMIPLILLIYSMPIYGTMWQMGTSDSNKANFGHIKLDRWRGAKLAAIGMSPWLVMGILFLLSKFGLFWNFVIPYKLLNAEMWPIINAMESSMYLPDFTVGQAIIAALLPVIPIFIAELGYILGTKDFSITQHVVYSNKKKQVPAAPQSTYEQYQQRQSYKGAAAQPEIQKKPSLMQRILYKNDDKK